MPAVLCYGLCHNSIQGFTECYPTHKKAGLSTVMSMWLVHTKEHMWSIGTCPTTILQSATSECVSECHIEQAKWYRYCLVWDGRPVCSSESWSGRGWLPLNKGMTQYAKWPKWNNCEVTLDNQCYSLDSKCTI